MCDRHFRPYEVVPGGPIWLEIETEGGRRLDVVGVVDEVPDVAAPSRAMRIKIVRARITPPLWPA